MVTHQAFDGKLGVILSTEFANERAAADVRPLIFGDFKVR
jgi:hypothetical protein